MDISSQTSNSGYPEVEQHNAPKPENIYSSFRIMRMPTFTPMHWRYLSALAAIYTVLTLLQWSSAYLDFGDGNYMYIARRIAQGIVPYRDMLVPQPPCHLFIGSAIAWVADIQSYFRPLYFFRAYSLLLHLATFAMVVSLARQIWYKQITAIVAGAIYLWLPINYWWAFGFQSEPLEICFLLAMILCALRGTLRGDSMAGIFAALAIMTNMTAAPFLIILFIYMLANTPKRAFRIFLSTLIITGSLFLILQIWTNGAFWTNVFVNQTGTYPKHEFISYALRKLNTQGSNVLLLEGLFVFAAFAGLWRLWRTSQMPPIHRDAVGWFLLATLGSILYVTKGGTMDYIFSLAGPAVAILSAGEIVAQIAFYRSKHDNMTWTGARDTHGIKVAKVIAIGAIMFWGIGPALNFYIQFVQKKTYELPENTADKLSFFIRRQTGPDEPILAPPFYAFSADRSIFGEFCELFIWQIKYGNDRMANHTEGEGWQKALSLAKAIEQKKIPLVILEMDQTGTIPEIMSALKTHYEPMPLEQWFGTTNSIDRGRKITYGMLITTKNTRLGIFTPVIHATPFPAIKEDNKSTFEAREASRIQLLWNTFERDLIRFYGEDEAYTRFGKWMSPSQENFSFDL